MGFWDSITQIANASDGEVVIQSGRDVVINSSSDGKVTNVTIDDAVAIDEIRFGGGVWINGKRVG